MGARIVIVSTTGTGDKLMKKRYKKKSAPRIRERPPRINRAGGGIEIQCPFCYPTHPLRVDISARCGTILELNAVQNLYQEVSCSLCAGTQGTLVKIGDRYKHIHECTPGKTIYTVPPKKSLSARLFWNLPDVLHKWVWNNRGRKVIQLSTEGQVTGYGWDRV